MTEWAFVSYFGAPIRESEWVVVLSPDGKECRQIALAELSTCDVPVVTYDSWRLVDALQRSGASLPSCLVDITDAMRLKSGLSRDQGGERQWRVWRALRPYCEVRRDLATIRKVCQGELEPPAQEELVRLLSVTAIGLAGLWRRLVEDMRNAAEAERFLEVEVPVQQVFWKRQYSGIKVDVKALARTLDVLRNETYDAFRFLASVLGFSPDGLNFWNVSEVLPRTDAAHLAEFGGDVLLDSFKIAREHSRFAAAFLQYQRGRRDLTILKAIQGGSDIIRPVFSCFGTVTGRILVSHPRLQELQKKYRRIITAAEGKALVYLDYAQCEPGILAALADDPLLKELYERQDLYLALSNAVFGDGKHRDACKRIFLAYCYGMSVENIARLLAGAEFSLTRIVEYRDIVEQFFGRFPRLAAYRKEMEERFGTEGVVATQLGNHRKRVGRGVLSSRERRWAVNHVIQGSASLIFKRAVIRISHLIGPESILLPMHDAVLLQCNEAEADDVVTHAKAEMVSAFQSVCPTLVPKVVQRAFSL